MSASFYNKELGDLQPFLNDSSDRLPERESQQVSHRPKPRECQILNPTRYQLTSRFCASEILDLPAREAVHWELRPFTTRLVNNPFSGEPRPELEEAWHGLVRNDHIKVPHRTLDELDLTSIQLQDGSGDVASLSTFHALHCLKKIRHMTYRDHYHKGKSATAMIREQAHSDHCVEYIREYLMCKPDLSLVTLHWINNTAQHPDDPTLRLPTSWDHSLHECVNWDSLNTWAGNRVVDLYQYDLLRQPDKGLGYSD